MMALSISSLRPLLYISYPGFPASIPKFAFTLTCLNISVSYRIIIVILDKLNFYSTQISCARMMLSMRGKNFENSKQSN